MKKPSEKEFTEKEAQARVEATLRGGLSIPHKPLKAKAPAKMEGLGSTQI